MKIDENVYSVGVVDEKVRIFHGYKVPYGTTYNSYLVTGEKIVLVDFVKVAFSDEFLKNIKNVIGDRKIDYIICNHVEEDHSGALPQVMAEYPSAIIYCTANAKKELEIFYQNVKMDFTVVKADEQIKLGSYTYKFIPMPMVHWPDSMSTYIIEKEILFSNDALGQHIAMQDFDDALGLEHLLERAADYYANIVLPFGMQVVKLLDNVIKLPIKMICPSHGVILRSFIGEMVAKYKQWATGYADENKLAIVYDTMWGTTAKMAAALQTEYLEKGFDVTLLNLSDIHYSEALKHVLESKYIFVGSPTLNNNIMPAVSAFLTYIKGLKPKGKIGLAFGSYGWSGESVAQINDFLLGIGFEMLPMQKVQWKLNSLNNK